MRGYPCSTGRGNEIKPDELLVGTGLVAVLVLPKTHIRSAPGHSDVNAWLAFDVIRIRVSKALFFWNDRVESNYIDVMSLLTSRHLERDFVSVNPERAGV